MVTFSYKGDPNIPSFEDKDLLVVFDGVCHFCSRSMRAVFEHEKQPIYFIPTQSILGNRLLIHYGLDPDDPASFIFLEKGKAKFSSSGVFALSRYVSGWPAILRVFWIIPRPLTDFAYKIFARNRYRWFGKSDTCMVPSDEMKSRLLDFPSQKAIPEI